MKKLILVCCMLVLMLQLVACSREIDKVSQSLNDIKIYAELDDTKMTLSCKQIVDYTNSSADTIDELYFTLSPNGYREHAKFTAVATEEVLRAYPNGMSYGHISIAEVKIGGRDCKFEIGGIDENALIVHFEEALYPDESLRIEMKYEVQLANVKHRLGYTDDSINIGNWYPSICVYQDFEYKSYPYYSNGDPFFYEMANYEVEFVLPSSYVVAHSGEMVQKIQHGESTTYVFKQNAIRDFAIVASEKFSVVEGKQNNVNVKYYYIDDTDFQQSLNTAKDCLGYFNRSFGNYEYDTLSVVQTDFLQGGMEFSNLVYISSDLSIASRKQVIIHEIAHEWWYMMVGSNQVTEPWLDEGLTDFSTSLYYKSIGDNSLMKCGENGYKGYLRLFTSMNSKIDTNMDRSLDKYTSMTEYIAMAYSKGQMLFANLYNDIGEEAFLGGIRQYFADNKYGIASKDKFIASFTKGSKRQLESYINSFMSARIFV